MTTEELFGRMMAPERFRKSTLNQNDFEYTYPFESDYFRIVTSAPFRRLQDKTQIFPLADCDFVRRRLTHSFEVSAYGERIGRLVEEKLVNKGKLCKNNNVVQNHEIAAVLKVAGLVHDIGNPPFGHFGEWTIQNYFSNMKSDSSSDVGLKLFRISKTKSTMQSNTKEENSITIVSFDRKTEAMSKVVAAFSELEEQEKSDLTHFDGNVQGFRVLRHLGLSTDGSSFNLTMPTLATIVKYPFGSIDCNIKGQEHVKIGFFKSEQADYDKMCQTLGLQKGKRHPLAYLLEAADDIANITSDVEDGWKMCNITYEDIENSIKEIEGYDDLQLGTINRFLTEANTKSGCYKLGEGALQELVIKEFRIRAAKSLINYAADSFVNKFDTIVGEAHESNPDYKQQHDDLWDENILKEKLSELQKKTYSNQSVLKSELQGEHIITSLLDIFLGAMFENEDLETQPNNTKSKEGKLYNLISENYRRMVMKKGEEFPMDNYRRFQLVIDFISGMTDSYAMDYYNELMAISK